MGRLKGNAFERQVAALIVEAFGKYGITKEDVYRTPGSGGHRYASKSDPGDLVISPKLRKYFRFHTECKAYAKVDVTQFLIPVRLWKKSWNCTRWMAQVTTATEKQEAVRLTPLLVFKENHGEILAALPMPAYDFAQQLLFQYEGTEWIVVRFKKLLRRLAS